MAKPKRPRQPWTKAAFTIDPNDKRDASNGISRYSSYLIDQRKLFQVSSYDGDVFTTDAHEFAGNAFTVGYARMSPRYIRPHRLVVGAEPHWDEYGRPAMTVRLAMPVMPEPLRMMTMASNGWHTLRSGDLAEPDNNTYRSAFASLTLRIPYGDLKLPGATYRLGAPEWTACRDAVALLVAHLNTELSAFLSVLDTPETR